MTGIVQAPGPASVSAVAGFPFSWTVAFPNFPWDWSALTDPVVTVETGLGIEVASCSGDQVSIANTAGQLVVSLTADQTQTIGNNGYRWYLAATINGTPSPLLAGPIAMYDPTEPAAIPTATSQDLTVDLGENVVAVTVSVGAGGAGLDSPAFSGEPTAPTPDPGDDSDRLATTAFTTGAVETETTRAEGAETSLTGAITAETSRAEGAESGLSTSIGAETSRAETAEALLAPLADANLTGVPTAPTAEAGTDTDQLATTAFAAEAVEAAIATIIPELPATPESPLTTEGGSILDDGTGRAFAVVLDRGGMVYNAAAYGVVAGVQEDQSAALNALINEVPEGAIVQLPLDQIWVAAAVEVLNDSITLRGMGNSTGGAAGYGSHICALSRSFDDAQVIRNWTAADWQTGRYDAGCMTTSGSSFVADTSTTADDAGLLVRGEGIPLGSYIASPEAGIGFTVVNINQVPANATASGSVELTIGEPDHFYPPISTASKVYHARLEDLVADCGSSSGITAIGWLHPHETAQLKRLTFSNSGNGLGNVGMMVAPNTDSSISGPIVIDAPTQYGFGWQRHLVIDGTNGGKIAISGGESQNQRYATDVSIHTACSAPKGSTPGTIPYTNSPYLIRGAAHFRFDGHIEGNPPNRPFPRWGASMPVSVGQIVLPATPSEHGYVFHATAAGVTGATEPSWPTSGTVADGTTTWKAYDWTAGQQPKTGVTDSWIASWPYQVGDMVVPTSPNYCIYQCTANAGSSGSSQPTWPTTIGQTVTDGGITWTCISGAGGAQGLPDPASYDDAMIRLVDVTDAEIRAMFRAGSVMLTAPALRATASGNASGQYVIDAPRINSMIDVLYSSGPVGFVGNILEDDTLAVGNGTPLRHFAWDSTVFNPRKLDYDGASVRWTDFTTGKTLESKLSDGERRIYLPAAAQRDNMLRINAGNSVTPANASGTLLLIPLPLMVGDLVTTISLWAGTTGLTSPTHQWAGLFDQFQNLVALSSDLTITPWSANTEQTFTLAAPFQVTRGSGGMAGNTYFVGLCLVASNVNAMTFKGAPQQQPIVNQAPRLLGTDPTHTGLTTPSSCPTTAALPSSSTTVQALPYVMTA